MHCLHSPLAQGTRVNPAAKLLLIDHAFAHGMVRVQLKTDVRNARSRAAIEKLGAIQEGVLRKHRPRPDGTWRDTVYYSILDDEWLGILAETGIAGMLALLWLFGRFVRRAGSVAKRSDSPEAWLLTAIVASVAAFGVGMATFDAFSFIQATFIFFILLALGGVLYEHLASTRRIEPIAP